MKERENIGYYKGMRRDKIICLTSHSEFTDSQMRIPQAGSPGVGGGYVRRMRRRSHLPSCDNAKAAGARDISRAIIFPPRPRRRRVKCDWAAGAITISDLPPRFFCGSCAAQDFKISARLRKIVGSFRKNYMEYKYILLLNAYCSGGNEFRLFTPIVALQNLFLRNEIVFKKVSLFTDFCPRRKKLKWICLRTVNSLFHVFLCGGEGLCAEFFFDSLIFPKVIFPSFSFGGSGC